MRIYSMETLSGDASEPESTIVLSQKFSHGHRRVRALAMAVGGLLLCGPFGLVLAGTASRARLLELAASEPAAVFQLAIVAAVALIALYFGVSELRRPVVTDRIIALNPGTAVVSDTVRGKTRRWQTPIDAFMGIRHRVFTTSGGTIHTLLLEHVDVTRSLHIGCETHIANQTIVDAARRYDLPVLEPASFRLGGRSTGWLSALLSKLGRTPSGDRQTAST